MSRQLACVLLAFSVVAASAPGTEAKSDAADQQRDLEGVWNFNSGVPLQRPAAVADRARFTPEEFEHQREIMRNGVRAVTQLAPLESAGLPLVDTPLYVDDLRTSLITYPANGRLPALVDGVKQQPRAEDLIALFGNAKGAPPAEFAAVLAAFGAGKKDTYKDFGLSERCLVGEDVPLLPGLADNFVQIIQGPDHVVLLTDSSRRLIPLDGPAMPSDAHASWSGTSRGHWDGNTLVVETRNFNERAASFAGVGTARHKVVTERFTRTAAGTLQYAATIVDPKTFRDRVEIAFPLAKTDAQIYEGACHEGNYSLANALKIAAAAELPAPTR